MNLKALLNHIIFQFEEDYVRVNDGKANSTSFKQETDWGFEFHDFQSSTDDPRWGIALVVGKDCELIKPGMRILIEPLQWTNGVDYEGERFWRTDETKVMAIDDAYE